MFQTPARILLIDDDVELVTLLVDYFQLEGFETTPAHCAEDGLKELEKRLFDIVILDVMMPGMSGTECLARIRERWQIPVLMLTARGDPTDRIVGLEIGADDYVAKPCPPRELVARIRAILRRSHHESFAPAQFTAGPITFDTHSHTAIADGRPIALTGTEITLLEVLARHVGSPVPKEDLYQQVLGRAMGRFDRTIDVHVSALRRKLSRAVPGMATIESVRGVGYRLVFLTAAGASGAGNPSAPA